MIHPIHKPFKTTITTTAALIMLALTGCLTAAPALIAASPECIQAARDAGLPEYAIRQLEQTGELVPIKEKIAQKALTETGIRDVCGFTEAQIQKAQAPATDQTDTAQSEPTPTRFLDRLLSFLPFPD